MSTYVVTGLLMQKKAKDVGCGKLAADLQCVFYFKKKLDAPEVLFFLILLSLQKGEMANVL